MSASSSRPSKALVPLGQSRRVYDSDLGHYLELLCRERLLGGRWRSHSAMLKGFWDVLPLELLQELSVSPQELHCMLSGAECDVSEWRLYANSCGGNQLSKQVVEWFWEAVEELSRQQRGRLLRFCTGSSRPPPGSSNQRPSPYLT